jgi:hypothetical protein
MEESKDTQADQTLEDQFHEEVDQLVAQGNKKRTLSEAQLATLAAGRKKRWSKKSVSPVLEEKEEEKVEEKEDVEVGTKKKKKTTLPVLEQSSSSDDSDDSCSSSAGEDTSGASSSDDYVSYPSASDQSSDSDLCSSDEIDIPPSPPVLRRQKARDLTAEKNARSARKMREYIQKSPYPIYKDHHNYFCNVTLV